MKYITISTQKEKEVVDITERIRKECPENATGVCIITVLHTTAALSVADLDPGTDLDMLDAFYGMVPSLDYRHPHDPAHVPDHILSTLIGVTQVCPVEEGRLVLGTWQRIVLFEFNGPKERNITLLFSKEM